jgi:hypothetical protein
VVSEEWERMGESWIAVRFIRVLTLDLFVLAVELEPFLFFLSLSS